ncbi:MAG TPA: hypothetical protein VFH11_07005 [Gemmatimonadota bacterium]|nr:hypothetical protein [Gemmatimonadota bacterium]
MESGGSVIWRALFVAGGLLYFVGAFNHPRGMTMADMLVDPAWIASHAGVFVGVLLMTMGLISFRRSVPVSQRTGRWLLATIVLSVLETIETGLHTMAYVDADALAPGAMEAGLSTPVLTLHLWSAILVYTPFAIALIGLILTGQRERALGSSWIGWLGIVGAAAHGSVMWLAIVLGVPGTGLLFPIAALAISLWFVLAGVWPTRAPVPLAAPGMPH